MRTRERLVAERITDLLTRDGPEPDPRALARVIGETLEASACAITVGQQRFQWGTAEGSWFDHDIGFEGGSGVLSVSPEWLGPLPAVAAVLTAPVGALQLSAEADRLRRDGDAAARGLLDERWRAAAEMEQERRSLERDLHDGAQHHLVALRLSLALAEHGGAAPERIADLHAQLGTVERVLAETASGVLPGALVADGVVSALRTQVARYENVTVDLTSTRSRYPAPVESAVYFVVLEAVNNARKHAPGARVMVAVRDGYRGLEFTVADDGPGFVVRDPRTALPGLAERAASVGGIVEVRSIPGAGTTVDGVVPL